MLDKLLNLWYNIIVPRENKIKWPKGRKRFYYGRQKNH